MTRALITPAFTDALNRSGLYLVVDAGNLTATLYRDKVKTAPEGHEYNGLQDVGKLSYSNQSVDYDALMQIVRSNA